MDEPPNRIPPVDLPQRPHRELRRFHFEVTLRERPSGPERTVECDATDVDDACRRFYAIPEAVVTRVLQRRADDLWTEHDVPRRPKPSDPYYREPPLGLQLYNVVYTIGDDVEGSLIDDARDTETAVARLRERLPDEAEVTGAYVRDRGRWVEVAVPPSPGRPTAPAVEASEPADAAKSAKPHTVPPGPGAKYISRAQLAERWRVSESTVDRRLREGLVTATKTPGGVKIPISDVRRAEDQFPRLFAPARRPGRGGRR